MGRLVLVLAFLGAYALQFATETLLSGTHFGRTVAFAVFFTALYPVGQQSGILMVSTRRYFSLIAVATLLFWVLDAIRLNLRPDVNIRVGMVVFGLATAALLYEAARRLSSSLVL